MQLDVDADARVAQVIVDQHKSAPLAEGATLVRALIVRLANVPARFVVEVDVEVVTRPSWTVPIASAAAEVF